MVSANHASSNSAQVDKSKDLSRTTRQRGEELPKHRLSRSQED